MTKVPLPRYDLLTMKQYAIGCVQISRGCPFQCEFCDIIVIFGRKPRIKTRRQVIAELDAHADGRVRAIVFLVDDNFIGNKKATKAVLRDHRLAARSTAIRSPSSPRPRSTSPRTTS